MHDIQSVVDHAAKQDDRWLMVAILVVGLVGMVLFWRWIVGDREKVANRLTTITDRHIDAQSKLGEVVANNTAALHEVKDAIVYCRDHNGRGRNP